MNFQKRYTISTTKFIPKETQGFECKNEDICVISTLEEAKWLARRIVYFKDLKQKENLSLNVFVEGIEPEWEDEKNANGSSFIVSLNVDECVNYIFEKLFFNFITNQFRTVEVNGIRVDVKKGCVKVAVWINSVIDPKESKEIFAEMSQMMGFETNIGFNYKKHQKCLEQEKMKQN